MGERPFTDYPDDEEVANWRQFCAKLADEQPPGSVAEIAVRLCDALMAERNWNPDDIVVPKPPTKRLRLKVLAVEDDPS